MENPIVVHCVCSCVCFEQWFKKGENALRLSPRVPRCPAWLWGRKAVLFGVQLYGWFSTALKVFLVTFGQPWERRHSRAETLLLVHCPQMAKRDEMWSAALQWARIRCVPGAAGRENSKYPENAVM